MFRAYIATRGYNYYILPPALPSGWQTPLGVWSLMFMRVFTSWVSLARATRDPFSWGHFLTASLMMAVAVVRDRGRGGILIGGCHVSTIIFIVHTWLYTHYAYYWNMADLELLSSIAHICMYVHVFWAARSLLRRPSRHPNSLPAHCSRCIAYGILMLWCHCCHVSIIGIAQHQSPKKYHPSDISTLTHCCYCWEHSRWFRSPLGLGDSPTQT